MRSPGAPPFRPRSPCPVRRTLAPDLTPAGTETWILRFWWTLPDPPHAPALLFGLLPASHARRTGPVDGEPALPEGYAPRSLALRALLPVRPGSPARAQTGGALLVDGDRDGNSAALHRRHERNVDTQLDVLSLAWSRRAGRPALPAPVENRREDLGEATESPQILEGEARCGCRFRPGRSRPGSTEAEGAQLPHLVVLLSLLRVGEDAVRLADLLETLGCPRVPRVRIRVILLGQSAVRLLDRGGVGLLVDAEDRVVVLVGLGHEGDSATAATPCTR